MKRESQKTFQGAYTWSLVCVSTYLDQTVPSELDVILATNSRSKSSETRYRRFIAADTLSSGRYERDVDYDGGWNENWCKYVIHKGFLALILSSFN